MLSYQSQPDNQFCVYLHLWMYLAGFYQLSEAVKVNRLHKDSKIRPRGVQNVVIFPVARMLSLPNMWGSG